MRTFGWCAVVLLVACGGKVEDSGQGSAGTTGPGAPGTPPSGNADASDDGTHFPATELPPCEKGFSPSDEPGRPCAWLTPDGLCYDTKIAACACLCRQTHGTTCSSGFPGGPDSRVAVDCL